MKASVLIEKYREKRCTKCDNIFPATRTFFSKQKRGLYGYGAWCCNCKKAYYVKNKKHIAKLRKLNYINNKEKANKQNNEWYVKNKEKRLKQIYDYREKNEDKVKIWNEKGNKIHVQRTKERRKTDPVFKLKNTISNLIRRSLKVKNVTKKNKSASILGCTIEEFKIYIESLFEPWMNWANYGPCKPELGRTWNFDHIIPSNSAKTEEEVIKLNHYTNLRPLDSVENISKHDKILQF